MSANPKLLFVSPEPAWLGRLGAHQRMQSIIGLLSKRYEVVKLAIGKDFGKMSPPGDWIVIDRLLGSALTDTGFHNQFVDFIKNNAIDVAYFNYYYFAPLARSLPDGITRVCDIHDVQHLRASSFAAGGETASSRVSKETELAGLDVFDRLVSINPNETRYLEDNIQTPVVTIPHIARFRKLVFKEQRHPIVVGSYAKANQDGFREILIPAVRDNFLTSTVLLAGGISLLAAEDATGRIIPMGQFNAPADVYPHASVALAPLRFGGGLKIKVIEALVHGVPVAGTECALDGIPELPPEVFFKFETGEDLAGLGDFIARTNPDSIRSFAEEHYAPEKYQDLVEF